MEICEKHHKNKEILCIEKTCMQSICSKCMKEHFHNGQHFISLDDLIEELSKKQNNSLSKIIEVRASFEKELKENKRILSDFDKNTNSFTEKVEKIMKAFNEYISKQLKSKKIERLKRKEILENWVNEAQKSIETLTINISALTKDCKNLDEAIKNKNYSFVYEKNKADGGIPIEKIVFLLEKPKEEFDNFKNSNFEKESTDFINEKFQNFIKLAQFTGDSTEKNKEIHHDSLEKNIESLKTIKIDPNPKETKKTPSIFLKNVENLMNITLEKSLKIENYLNNNFEKKQFFDQNIKFSTNNKSPTKQQISKQFTSPSFLFNIKFPDIAFSGDALICQNKLSSTRYCFSVMKLKSIANYKIDLLFTPGCKCSGFGLIEDFSIDFFANDCRIWEIKDKEVFYYKSDGETSDNLNGIKEKMEKRMEFEIIIKNNTVTLSSKDEKIHLNGKMNKEVYYFGVSLCCQGNVFQILKFKEE